MSANGKKWSQYAEATEIADGDKVLVRDVSEAAGSQIKEITKANLSDTLGLAGHIADTSLHMTKADINDRQLNKDPSNAIVGDGVDDYVSMDSALLEFGDSLTDIACGESAIIEIDDLANAFIITSKATGSAPNNERTFQVLTSGKLEIKLIDSSTSVYIGQTGSTVLEAGKRYFVAWTYDGSGTSAGIKLYVGAVAETLTLTEAGAYTAMHTSIAALYLLRYSGNYGKGKIYSYVPWNRELSATDIALLAANGNQPEPADRWGNATELLTDGGLENWTGSTLDDWAEGGSITLAEETSDVQEGSSAADLTPGGGQSSSSNNALRQDSVVPVDKSVRVKFRVKNVSAGTLEFGPDFRHCATWNGTTLTETESELQVTWTAAKVLGSRSRSLGSSWYEITVDFQLNSSGSAASLRFAGSGQWLIDGASLRDIGAVASHQGRNLESDRSVDESSNEINGTLLGGATRLFEPRSQVSGSFTPTLYFGPTLQTVGSAVGQWWKDGVNDKIVYFHLRIASPAAVTDAGNAVVQGLPFVAANDDGKQMGQELILSSMTGVTGSYKALNIKNTDDVNIYQTTATGVTPLTNAQFTTSSVIHLTGKYEIA